MLLMLLAKMGYQDVVTASDGESCLQRIAERAAKAMKPVDVILMDCNLGAGMDGEECTRRIREQQLHEQPTAQATVTGAAFASPSPPCGPYIIAQTATVTEELRQRCKSAGMYVLVTR